MDSNSPLDSQSSFPENKSAWPVSLKQGSIWGLLAVVLSLMIYLTVGIENAQGFTAAGIISTIVSVIIAFTMLFLAMKTQRDEIQNGLLSFGEALKVGFLTTLVYALILILYNFIFTQWIEPDLTADLFEAQIEAMEEAGSSEEEIEMTSKIFGYFQNPIIMTAFTFFYSLASGLFFSLILAAIVNKTNR